MGTTEVLTSVDLATLADVSYLLDQKAAAELLIEAAYRVSDGLEPENLHQILADLSIASRSKTRGVVFSDAQRVAWVRAVVHGASMWQKNTRTADQPGNAFE